MKCLVLLYLLVATASAAPGLLGSVRESLAGSLSQTHSLGGDLNFGPLKIGANLNSAHSASHSKASALDSGYGTSGSYAEANAESEALAASQAHSLGAGLGFGPFSLGGNIRSSHSQAQSSSQAFNGRYRRQILPFGFSGSRAQASAQSEDHSLGGGLGFGPFSLGANLHSSHSQAQSNSQAFNGRYRRHLAYNPYGYGGTYSGAQAQAHASSGTFNNNYPQTYGSGFLPQSSWLG